MKLDKLDEKDKISILLNLLSERYQASHLMRERSLKFAIWILGFVVVAIPWLLLRKELTQGQKIFLTILTIILGGATFLFLRAIHIGFNKNWGVIAKLEEALGCYEKGLFLNSIQLFPEEYRNVRKVSSRSHFVLIYSWLVLAALITIVSIWMSL
jgi:ABC-type branched-subunit amino acid transport system permease subunit